MSKARVLGLVVAVLSSVTLLITKMWNRLAIHCSNCCHPVAGNTVSTGERLAWCPRCQQVFEAPLLKAPSWVTGVVAVLLINMQ